MSAELTKEHSGTFRLGTTVIRTFHTTTATGTETTQTPAMDTVSTISSAVAANAAVTTGNTDSGSGTSSSAGAFDGRCESVDCNVVKLLSMVPKRKTNQFVTEPNVMEKPMLINGFTTVFQVDGMSAKLNDLKNPQPNIAFQPKTIYRIVPNTHAHIVNYVVIDADNDSLRKINESDPATMRKLLDSQKVSADQMLRKLMAGHGQQTSNSTAKNCTNTTTTAATLTGSLSSSSTATPIHATRAAASNTPSVNKSTTSSGQKQASPPIQLPMRMHPNLKITAVASADNVAAFAAASAAAATTMTATPAPTTSSLPLITPVPLANLQNAPQPPPLAPANVPVMPLAINAPTAGVAAPVMPVVDTVDKPVFDKMQAELQELRRTVAMLAEAQAKNQQVATQQQQQQQPIQTDSYRRGVKRPLC